MLTVDPTEARRARTGVAVHAVRAVGPVLAGVTGTLVHVFLAFGALEACQAVAGEAVDAVRTGAPVVAGIWGGRGDKQTGITFAAPGGEKRACGALSQGQGVQ